MSTLQKEYQDQVLPNLGKQLGRSNPHAIPKLEKIVVSMGVGRAKEERKRLEEAMKHLGQLAGQAPHITRSRKAIAAFRLREGMEVGCRVTLRKRRMYEFLERLVMFALPRVRDFRGLNPNGFDGNGNYSMGLNEQLVFPEIDPDSVSTPQGMNITFVTTAKTNDEGRMLLKELGMPFRTAQV